MRRSVEVRLSRWRTSVLQKSAPGSAAGEGRAGRAGSLASSGSAGSADNSGSAKACTPKERMPRVRKSDQLPPTSRIHPIVRLIREEEGSVEAGLTLIPLTLFFLISAQLLFASQWGSAQLVDQQSRANKVTIIGDADSQNVRDHERSSNEKISYQPLIGGGHLVISERSRSVPFLANLAGAFSNQFLYRKRTVSLSEVFTQ